MSVANHPSSVIEKSSTTYVRTRAVVHRTNSLTQDAAKNQTEVLNDSMTVMTTSKHDYRDLMFHVISVDSVKDPYVQNLTDKTSRELRLKRATVHCPNVLKKLKKPNLPCCRCKRTQL
jgi:Tfp pilus assembly protein PilV